MIFTFFNQFEQILLQYNTSQPFNSFLTRAIVNLLISSVITSVLIIMPSLAGESIYYEMNDKRKEGSFLHYLRSTFLSREVAQSIILGYLVCATILGLQSIIIKIGQTFWGVWVEHTWMNDLSTAYFPFLAALIIGLQASFNEELIYRLFAINWLKKIGASAIVAVVISALIWGFSHTNYPVYPMWFRGVEVSILGIAIGLIYLKFGLIVVLVSHFVFNAFWLSAAYILTPTMNLNFITCLGVCLLPLLFAIVALIANRSTEERKLEWNLNKHQTYNLKVLLHYLTDHWILYAGMSDKKIIKEITSHGWDMAVVEEALKVIRRSKQTRR